MWVNNNATGSRGVEYREYQLRHMIKAFMPYIPRTDEYYNKYAVFSKYTSIGYGYRNIIEIRTKAQDVMEEHMKWHNELFKDEKPR
jgi:hypothetical protein